MVSAHTPIPISVPHIYTMALQYHMDAKGSTHAQIGILATFAKILLEKKDASFQIASFPTTKIVLEQHNNIFSKTLPIPENPDPRVKAINQGVKSPH